MRYYGMVLLVCLAGCATLQDSMTARLYGDNRGGLALSKPVADPLALTLEIAADGDFAIEMMLAHETGGILCHGVVGAAVDSDDANYSMLRAGCGLSSEIAEGRVFGVGVTCDWRPSGLSPDGYLAIGYTF